MEAQAAYNINKLSNRIYSLEFPSDIALKIAEKFDQKNLIFFLYCKLGIPEVIIERIIDTLNTSESNNDTIEEIRKVNSKLQEVQNDKKYFQFSLDLNRILSSIDIQDTTLDSLKEDIRGYLIDSRNLGQITQNPEILFKSENSSLCNKPLFRSIFGLSKLDIQIQYDTMVLLSSLKLKTQKNLAKKKGQGFRVRGNCIDCKKNILKKIDNCIFKQRSDDPKASEKLSTRKYLQFVSTKVEITHKTCFIETRKKLRKMKKQSKFYKQESSEDTQDTYNGPITDKKGNKDNLRQEEKDDFMDMLNEINDMEVGRDYLGAFMQFDIEAENINSELHYLY